MKYTPKQYAQSLYEALNASRPEDQEKVLDNFTAILKQNGDLGKFAEIEQAFIEAEKKAGGIKTAEVTAARKLTDNEEQKLVHKLNEFLGSKVELKQKVNAGIIGGVIVQVEDKLIDASIKRHLHDLKNDLTQE